MFMKDLLVSFIENIFHIGYDEEITLKKLIIIVFKVVLFLLAVSLFIWIAIQLKKQNYL